MFGLNEKTAEDDQLQSDSGKDFFFFPQTKTSKDLLSSEAAVCF